MDVTNANLLIGHEINGKYGKYRIKREIGRGGNGAVFTVDIVEDGGKLPENKEYVIKIFFDKSRGKKESKKRKTRFEKEIKQLISFQNEVEGIISIYDSSFISEKKNEAFMVLNAYS